MSRYGRAFLVLSVIFTLILGLGAGAVAGERVPPIDTGKVGLHALQASAEYPTITCRYEASALISIRISPPRVFARNRTAGVDRQRVAWRPEIVYWHGDALEYVLWQRGPRFKATATDRRSAAFAAFVYHVTAPSKLIFEVRYRFSWYQPGSTTTVQGRALHYATLYRTNAGFLEPYEDGCGYDEPPTSPGPIPPGHSGQIGVHFPIGSTDTATVICRYGPDPIVPLERLLVRQPIVFARSIGPGVQTGTVGWRFRVEGTNDPIGPGAHWTLLDRVPFVRARATDRQPAVFEPRAYPFSGDVSAFTGYRVRYDLRWYGATGEVLGRASGEEATFYARQWSGGVDIYGLPCPWSYD